MYGNIRLVVFYEEKNLRFSMKEIKNFICAWGCACMYVCSHELRKCT